MVTTDPLARLRTEWRRAVRLNHEYPLTFRQYVEHFGTFGQNALLNQLEEDSDERKNG
jgi:hypothetical protein